MRVLVGNGYFKTAIYPIAGHYLNLEGSIPSGWYIIARVFDGPPISISVFRQSIPNPAYTYKVVKPLDKKSPSVSQ